MSPENHSTAHLSTCNTHTSILACSDLYDELLSIIKIITQ